MWHPSEDDLILRFYGETAGADEAQVREHLQSCGDCRALWDELGRTLTLVDRAAVPEPPDGFERVMWARVERALPEQPSRWTWASLVPALSFATAIAVVVTVAALWRSAPSGPADPASSTVSSATSDSSLQPERVLLTALDNHFEQTELLLVELMNAPEDDLLGLGFERIAAGDLVAAGRLYRATAEQTGHVRLVQMLEDLEPVLVEVARSPDKVDRRELNSLRSRIDDNGLLFKVRAVTHDIRERQNEIVIASEGGI